MTDAERKHNNKLKPKAHVIREYVRKHPDNTHKQFVDETCVKVGYSQFAAEKRHIRIELGLPVPPSSKKKPVQKPLPLVVRAGTAAEEAKRQKALESKIERLQAENAYLRWRADGERHGYVQRLLDDESK